MENLIKRKGENSNNIKNNRSLDVINTHSNEHYLQKHGCKNSDDFIEQLDTEIFILNCRIDKYCITNNNNDLNLAISKCVSKIKNNKFHKIRKNIFNVLIASLLVILLILTYKYNEYINALVCAYSKLAAIYVS